MAPDRVPPPPPSRPEESPGPALAPAGEYDWINDVLVPLCVLGALWSFTRFCLDVRESLLPVGSSLLRYVLFWFLAAVVGIVKIRSMHGDPGAAAPYTVALAIAVLLVLLRFTSEAGGIVSGSGAGLMNLAINVGILGLIWWGADSITRDCTVDEYTEEAEAPGLLAELSGRFSEKQRRRRRPGRSIFHFSAAALLCFGLGQMVLSRAPSGLSRSAHLSVAAYVAFALGLLAFTNFSGLRMYLQRRRVDVPGTMLPAWVAATALTTAIVLLVASSLPKGRAPSAALDSGATQFSREGRNRGLPDAPGGGFSRSEGQRTHRTPSQDSTASKGPAADAAARSGERREQGGSGARGSVEASGKSGGAGQGGEGGRGRQAQRSTSSRGEGSGGRGGSPSPPGGAQPSQTSPLHQWPAPGEGLGGFLRWVPLILVGLLLAGALIAYRDRVAAAWRSFLAALARWMEALRRLRLPGLRKASGGEKKPFANPFGDASLLERLPPRELVLQTYGGFMALAEGMGCPRPPDQTPFEFLRRLPQELKPLAKEARTLSHLYMLAEYSVEPDLSGQMDRLREIWERLDVEAQRVEALALEQRVA